MSAVGTDAAYMLEKALEEMDDIFKDEDVHQPQQTFIQSSTPVQVQTTSQKSSRRTENKRNLIKLLDELEFLLSGQMDGEESFLKSNEKTDIINYCRTLSFVSVFFKELCSKSSKVKTYVFIDCSLSSVDKTDDTLSIDYASARAS